MTGAKQEPGTCRDELITIVRQLGVLRQFQRQACGASSIRTLEPLLAKASEQLGFAYYAMVEHGELGVPGALILCNYPARWQSIFKALQYHRIDPVHQACRQRVAGFRWSSLDEIMNLTPAQRSVLSASQVHGIGEGFTVPFHLPGARAASCSFAVKTGSMLPSASLPAAQLLAAAAYERVHALGTSSLPEAIRLSPRQRACVALIAAGHTDHDIAERLGLSEETVTKYLNQARRRNGLARRAQLVAAALRDGLIGFDAMDS